MCNDKQTALPLTRLDDVAVLSVEGPDAATFLQGQVTCDAKGLGDGRMTLGAMCNAKGRTIAVFRLVHQGGRYLLVLRADMIEAVRRRLQMYVLRSRVTITDARGKWRALGLLGAIDGAPAETIGLTRTPAVGESASIPHGAAVLAVDETDKFMILAPPQAASAIEDSLIRGGYAQRVSPTVWEQADIRDGIPTVTPATTEEFVPQMLNLDLVGGISFNKGCYTGQEIVARTHYLGSVKRRMHRFRADCTRLPEAGTRLYLDNDEAPAGRVVAAVALPCESGYDLLAIVTVEETPRGTIRLWSSAGPQIHGLPLPYFDDPVAAEGFAR